MKSNSENATTILVVDDEEYLRRIVIRILAAKGYVCAQAGNGCQALQAMAISEFALLISDINMPEMTGVELLRASRHLHPDTAVIMLTGVDSQETAIQSLEQGAYGYMIKPFQANELLINVVNALRRRELEMAHDTYERQLEREVLARTDDIHRREEEITLRLVTASEYRDEQTGTHIRRMAHYATLLAQELAWPAERVELLRLAAPMHDVGKIGVPDRILLKPGKLTTAELELMQNHTFIGTEILKNSDYPLLQMASEVALCHHERWDGSGYPRGLVGEVIPESARIVAMADVYDALHTDRIYRPAFSEQAAMELMDKEQAKYDPRVYACMLNQIDEFRRIRRELAD